MLSKNQISFIQSLNQKKIRKEEGLFIAEGEKIVNDLLESSFTVKKIFAVKDFSPKKRNRNGEWIEVTEAELKKISSLTNPNKVLAIAEIPSLEINIEEMNESLNIVLDDISDPGNLGTMIRIADWFGIENIICSNETADCYNPKVVQASMGSLFRTKVHYTDLPSFFELHRFNFKIYGTSLTGKNIYSSGLSSNGLIVFGNESKGVKNELEKYFTDTLYIPSFNGDTNRSSADSLNVAVAAAIVCGEFRRRLM